MDSQICKPNFLNSVAFVEDDGVRRKRGTLVDNFPMDPWENKVEPNHFRISKEMIGQIFEVLEIMTWSADLRTL